MNELIEWLKGKKSYIVAGIMIVLGVLQGFGFFILPEWAWVILTGLLGASLRASVNKIADTIKPQ